MVVYAGWQLGVYWRSGSSIFKLLDGIQRFSYQLINNIDAKEECGTRYPKYLTEGVYGTSGTLERFYTGSGTWALFQGQTGGETALTYVDLQVFPDGSGSAKPFIQLGGIKLNKNGVSHRPGSNVMEESWDFMGTGSFSTGTTA